MKLRAQQTCQEVFEVLGTFRYRLLAEVDGIFIFEFVSFCFPVFCDGIKVDTTVAFELIRPITCSY